MLLLVPPSLTVTVIVAEPNWLVTGVKLSEPVPFGLVYDTVGFGIRLVLLDVAVTVRVWVSFAAPEEMPERFTVWRPEFSLTVTSARALTVGGWLTGLTVTMNVRETMLLLVPPSLT